MKYIYYIFFALLILSCKQEKADTIEMVSAEQVYEAIYGASPQEDIQLIDVRKPEEYSVSHLKEAQNICVSKKDFKEKVAKLDKNKPVYVYCQGGGESAQAAEILKELGFTKVYDLEGGLNNWNSEGRETVN